MTGKIDFDRVLENLAGRKLIGFQDATDAAISAAPTVGDKEDAGAAGCPASLKSTTAKRGVKP